MKKILFIMALAVFALFFSCKKKTTEEPKSQPKPDTGGLTADGTTSIEITRAEKFQSIDGFGFFGAQDVWWGSANDLFSDAWATAALTDLGVTIWRNEYYPPVTASQAQDATWDKQKPVVEGLLRIANQNKVPLKFIFTVWSPPASMKVQIVPKGQPNEGDPISGLPNTGGTKGADNEGITTDDHIAGTLDPAKYALFGNWLADGIQLYKNLGIDVYAISPQNEPLFRQPFNSSYYKPSRYAEMLKNAMPVVKARFPNVKIFGSENMLDLEAGDAKPYFYGASLMPDVQALNNLDIWAFHGYQEGITPTATSKLKNLWSTVNTTYTQPTGKPVWMTETSGYTENWLETSADKSGALDLALDIQSALIYGNASAWVWWQGSGYADSGVPMTQMGEYNLMSGTQKGKKYYASKHFYRFIRPGAKRVKLTFNETDKVLGSAFEHTSMGAFTIVLINTSDKNMKVNFLGANIPDEFDFYYSNATANCVKQEAKVKKTEVVLPKNSIVTLVNGSVVEQ
ncbi:MAG TPA: hypothetical protein VF602_11560 [Pedobacter sp.]|jgi:O-glycosyl hydrolase